MADALGVLGSMAALSICAGIINNYSLSPAAVHGSAMGFSNLMSELRSLEASLSSLRHLMERVGAPSSDGYVLEMLANTITQMEDAQRRYGIEHWKLLTNSKIFHSLSWHITNKIIPPAHTLSSPLKDPHSTLFILTCILYTFLYTRLRENQRDDRHQDKFILGGVEIEIAAAVYTKDWGNSKGYVAWCAIAA